MRDLQRLREPNGLPVPVHSLEATGIASSSKDHLACRPPGVYLGREPSAGEQCSPFAIDDLGQFEDFLKMFKQACRLAPPKAQDSPAIAWLKHHGSQYSGLWVALDGKKLIAWGGDGRRVFEQARRKGYDKPMMVKVPPRDERPFGGW